MRYRTSFLWSPRRFCQTIGCLFILIFPVQAVAADGPDIPAEALAAGSMAPLPPTVAWDGATRRLIAADDDPWLTPVEKSRFQETPNYEDTIAWLSRLVETAPQLEMTSLGKTAEGRDVWMVIATAGKRFTPEALHRSGKPILLVQAGIHPGEIDGKDAGMMFLRDLTVGGKKGHLLDGAHLLFVPIFNVDGHERRSAYSRMNQRGPLITGWRTSGRNLNFNRDYAKIDAPGMQAMIHALGVWKPDLYVDVHVTDGADYEYDITWGGSGPQGHSPNIARFVDEELNPRLVKTLQQAGHVPGPLVFAANGRDMSGGLFDWSAAGPRYSDGYGSARHLPTLLVENHSLKPYEQRVLGTYVLYEALLQALAEIGNGLREATAQDRARRPERVPLAWRVPQNTPPERIPFLGVVSKTEPSEISGTERVLWTGETTSIEVQLLSPTEASAVVDRPTAYWIPPVWTEVIERLRIHGVEMETLRKPRDLDVEMYRFSEVELADAPFEGHVQVSAKTTIERHQRTFPAGSVRIATDQPLGHLTMMLLEPDSPDSFFQWGFFLEILQRTEYFEAYVMEPLAERLLEEDPELARAFAEKLAADPDFAGDPRARLEWFYEKTPYYDPNYRLYPVARER